MNNYSESILLTGQTGQRDSTYKLLKYGGLGCPISRVLLSRSKTDGTEVTMTRDSITHFFEMLYGTCPAVPSVPPEIHMFVIARRGALWVYGLR